MAEVPRIWRLMKTTMDPKLTGCGNCGGVAMEVRRPLCKECGLVFAPEEVVESDSVRTEAHRVVGQKMRVYFNQLQPDAETPTLVEFTARQRVEVDS